MLEVLQASVWRPTSVAVTPKVQMQQWQVFRVDGNDHIVGWNLTESEGRVSGSALEVSLDARKVRTGSGRVYELVGPSGFSRDGHHVFSVWKQARRPREVVDVTADYEAKQWSP